jgi:hypothetical protein
VVIVAPYGRNNNHQKKESTLLPQATAAQALQQIVLFRRGVVDLAHQALGWVDRQVAVGRE